MTPSIATDAWGIDSGYEDATGVWRETSRETRASLLAAMGLDPDEAPPADESVRVLRQDTPLRLDRHAELTLEDGARLRLDTGTTTALPLGYHDLTFLDTERTVRLIVAPPRCVAPPTRAWGWAVQVYALRSAGSWGMGDFGDLRRLGAWSRDLGARLLLVNPFLAAVPGEYEDPSPYSPSSRRYRNPVYLRIEDIPGGATLGTELEPLARAGRALNASRRIDRAEIRRLKRDALERLWRRFPGDAALDRWVTEEGRGLHDFAVFTALAEQHGGGWQNWPEKFRQPGAPAVRHFAEAHADRVRFHSWVQWLLHVQLERASREIALLHDFPIGVNGNGADAWAWQDVLAVDASVGAPPDRYSRNGQDWGLPPFVPVRLRARRYEPFIETLRGVLRYGGGLRVDHVMGLFRLFWIPRGCKPTEGGYVRYPTEDLLAIVALESHRAGAFVVGEDLGTVEPGVRERLAELGILSYRVLWFESGPPESYPALALASATTHDLPTIPGIWTGSDVAAQQRLGFEPNVGTFTELRRRLSSLSGVPEGSPVEAVVEGTYAALGRAPSAIVTATLEDALAVEERPNMPGTFGTWPNWSLALPAPLEEIEHGPLPLAVARALESSRGGSRA
jgi:4-alpha-glucanotransferase